MSWLFEEEPTLFGKIFYTGLYGTWSELMEALTAELTWIRIIIGLLTLVAILVGWKFTIAYEKIRARLLPGIASPEQDSHMGHLCATLSPLKHVYRLECHEKATTALHQLSVLQNNSVFVNDSTMAAHVLATVPDKSTAYNILRYDPHVPDLLTASDNISNGAGGGDHSSRYKAYGATVAALDISPESLDEVSGAMLAELSKAAAATAGQEEEAGGTGGGGGKKTHVDIAQLLAHVSLDCLCAAAFGYDLGATAAGTSTSSEGARLVRSLQVLEERQGQRSIFGQRPRRDALDQHGTGRGRGSAPATEEDESEAKRVWGSFLDKMLAVVRTNAVSIAGALATCPCKFSAACCGGDGCLCSGGGKPQAILFAQKLVQFAEETASATSSASASSPATASTTASASASVTSNGQSSSSGPDHLADADLIILAEIHQLLRHGYESLSGSLSWIFVCLHRQPRARMQLEKCLKAGTVGKGKWPSRNTGGRTVDTRASSKVKPATEAPAQVQQLQELPPYAEAFLKETLRMFPVNGNSTVRTTNEDSVIGGCKVPRGTDLHVHMFSLHRSRKEWLDPNTFRPERFLGEEKDVDGNDASAGADAKKTAKPKQSKQQPVPRCPFNFSTDSDYLANVSAYEAAYDGVGHRKNTLAFFPFLAGDRACLGKRLSLTVLRRVLTDVPSLYRFESAMDAVIGTTVKAVDPLSGCDLESPAGDLHYDEPGVSTSTDLILPLFKRSTNVYVTRILKGQLGRDFKQVLKESRYQERLGTDKWVDTETSSSYGEGDAEEEEGKWGGDNDGTGYVGEAVKSNGLGFNPIKKRK